MLKVPKKKVHSAEVQKLQIECKHILESRNKSQRAASYEPSLEEFQNRFCEYIREELLGVTYDDDDSDSDDDENDKNNDNEKNNDNNATDNKKNPQDSRIDARPKESKIGMPCPIKISDGMAKITPPKGWWDYAGISNDLTGRGPAVS